MNVSHLCGQWWFGGLASRSWCHSERISATTSGWSFSDMGLARWPIGHSYPISAPGW